MEGAQSVDVSWLHHSNREHQAQKKAPALKLARRHSESTDDKPPPVPEKNSPVEASSTTTTNGTSHGDKGSHGIHRPHLHLHHAAESKEATAAVSPGRASKEKPVAPALSRKGSWLSSLKSQFSSSPQSTSPSPSPAAKPVPPTTTEEQANGTSASPSAQKDGKKTEHTSQTPQSPKSAAPSFLQSALRRLSASSGSMGKMSGTGGICPRKVLNVDPYRERCQIEELQPAKLRRVSFCVDVEIAGHATYVDEDEEEAPPTPGRRPSLAELERHAANKKAKEQNVKMKDKAEGEALKRPDAVAEAKEKTGDIQSTEKKVQQTTNPVTNAAADEEQPQASKKKEKKKRSEEERKRRKEKRRQQAVANGSIPLEITKETSSSESLSPGPVSPARQRDKPTTDPLRIYKRCCQLRETHALKKVIEQLSSPSACDPLSYGTVLCLDFTGSRMQLPDIITLGDYLAVVPVKKVILEDCDLTDEAVRVILAGLLAVKTPDQAKFNRELVRSPGERPDEKTERLGVVEKISLKNNPRIGRDGWRHIALFIHMSRSLKAVDLSMIRFPPKADANTPGNNHHTNSHKTPAPAKITIDPGLTFEKCLVERPKGSRLEELVMAECGLNAELVKKFVRGVKESGLTRLGLASNNLDAEGLEAVADFVGTGNCEGLDLGGNALSEDLLDILVRSLQGQENRLYALSLADCKLSPDSLKALFPALARLPNFRFIDLSHNRRLFSTQPNALNLLRRYLPRMGVLKRIHLNDVAMEPEHCIALAEVLPEIPQLGHIGILENPQISALASPKDEASREEACALYASLMAAVRVSESIICIDVDVPSAEAGAIVQALAKQVVAYSLRNMERGPIAEITADETQPEEKAVEIPEVLLHIVGHGDAPGDVKDDEPAPDDDYIVGGTGVVKALSVCLGNKSGSDYRRMSGHNTPCASGTATPRRGLHGADVKGRAMSKNLLGSARKIRARLQPAIAREEKIGDEMAYRRLKFLDSTLERIIQRFEDEYPECRLHAAKTSDTSILSASPTSTQDTTGTSPSLPFRKPFSPTEEDALDDGETSDTNNNNSTAPIRPQSRNRLSRRDSDVSIASRYLAQEEGRMLRFGTSVRRDLLPQGEDNNQDGAQGTEKEGRIESLREKLDALSGSEIREKIERLGYEGALEDLGGGKEGGGWAEEVLGGFEKREEKEGERN